VSPRTLLIIASPTLAFLALVALAMWGVSGGDWQGSWPNGEQTVPVEAIEQIAAVRLPADLSDLRTSYDANQDGDNLHVQFTIPIAELDAFLGEGGFRQRPMIQPRPTPAPPVEECSWCTWWDSVSPLDGGVQDRIQGRLPGSETPRTYVRDLKITANDDGFVTVHLAIRTP
jgi:hypothetical protein